MQLCYNDGTRSVVVLSCLAVLAGRAPRIEELSSGFLGRGKNTAEDRSQLRPGRRKVAGTSQPQVSHALRSFSFGQVNKRRREKGGGGGIDRNMTGNEWSRTIRRGRTIDLSQQEMNDEVAGSTGSGKAPT